MTAPVIKLASSREKPAVVCWPWHLYFLAESDTHPRGGQCSFCQRDVAVTAEGRPVCMYCALDRGLIAAEERPLFPEVQP